MDSAAATMVRYPEIDGCSKIIELFDSTGTVIPIKYLELKLSELLAMGPVKYNPSGVPNTGGIDLFGCKG